ncbi:MFS transporter [Paenibacillus alkalitolerans]|uniref:MFS transporter n=1 Tax=Paenibacillus alkalitolerans TaxID=2799335 RepID=UPI0018F50ABD|nr:MFS transporter [Paenibacillus alkalitolerans]
MKNGLVYVFAIGGFLLGTAESIVAGIIEMMSSDLQVSVSSVGQFVTSFALGFGIGSPILIALTAKYDRKKVLLTSLVLFAAGNALTFFVSSFELILLFRLLAGTGGGAYIAVALAVATKLVSEDKRGSAIGIIATGVTSALVIGVPLGTLLSQAVGWRYLFIIIGILSLILSFIISRYMPVINDKQKIPLSEQIKILKDKAVIACVLVSLFIVLDYATLLTYLTPFIQSFHRLTTEAISMILLAAGIASMIGSRLGGYLTDKWGSKSTIYTGLLLQAAILLLSSMLGTTMIGMISVILIWIGSLWIITPSLQFYLVTLSPKAPDIAQSVNLSFFQFGLALGPLLGGVIINSSSASNLGWTAGIVALIAMGFAIFSFAFSSKRKNVAAA